MSATVGAPPTAPAWRHPAAAGTSVHREYYVNDHGRQMDILAVSVWLRYLELAGEKVGFPSKGYRGDYIYDIAREVRKRHGDDLRHSGMVVAEGLPADGPEGDPKNISMR
jgi:arginyl-tRNA synthetase